MAEERNIQYINRDFGDLREQLVEFSKNYFPDSYNDFSPTSPGMMFIEMAAYVGDILSFYQDNQLQETFLQHAKNPSNLYSLAYMMGYRPRVTSVSEVELTVTQRVQARGSEYKPDFDQALSVRENAIIAADIADNPTFLTRNSIDFNFSSSYDPTEIRIHSLDNGNPAEYLLTKKINAYSGTIKTTSKTYTVAEKFATFDIQDASIIGILDVTDSDGKVWTEVPFLGQDTMFDDQTNTNSDSTAVPNKLKLKKVPRRFVTRFLSNGNLQVQFGSGISAQSDETIVPNPTNIRNSSTFLNTNEYFKAYDPSNFLFTQTYGLAPSNTTLTIRYLTGGGVAANAPANTVNSINTVVTSATDDTFAATLTFNNNEPAAGGKDGDSTEELRQNSLRAFAEQQRTVTLQDYSVRALSLPATYGTIAKVYTTQDSSIGNDSGVLGSNPLAVGLYVLAYDNNKKVIKAAKTLKQNLKTYISQFMPVTDAVDIKDAFVVNIGVKYEVLALPNTAARDVILRCNNALIDYFNIDKWSINEPVNLSTLYTLLDKQKGVQTVRSIKLNNKTGGKYSLNAYDVEGATKDNIVYPSYDPCIFEVKYPNDDIEGRVTTL
jgi:hypothetical protein|tara:strand:+ start:1414 stop:3228 length:1815 start_codon:yes stop_codon:yes gene_type:complete